MIHKKSNYQIAISSLTNARPDHYDGVNAIFRLAACIPIPEGTSPDGVRRQVTWFKKELSNLDVRGNRINIHDDMLEIDFYPKGNQMVMTKGQYAGLQLEFAEFLDRSGIYGIKIQDGCYGDDPEDSVKIVSNDMVNFFPEFNSTCFGAEDGEPFEIINCTLRPEYFGVR